MGFKKIEAIVSTLIFTILLIFVYLVALADPSISGIFQGFLPTAQLFDKTAPGHESILTLALGIVGATVMPHNLYLHSSLSQTRKVDYNDPNDIRKAVRFMTWDSNIQLSLAFIVNSLLLILGAALFFGHASEISAFSQMYNALQDSKIAGAVASSTLSTLFAVALLASGQNSTITGTLTGQIVMEGFLHIEITTMDYPTRNAIICVVTCDCSGNPLWGTRKNIGPTLGLLTSILISGVTIFHLPVDLLHFKEITHGRIYQCQMEYLPWICGSGYPNHLKL